jgi:hypothetical protein
MDLTEPGRGKDRPYWARIRRWGSLRATVRPHKEANMDNTTLLIIIILVVILLGGGWYGRGRWF